MAGRTKQKNCYYKELPMKKFFAYYHFICRNNIDCINLVFEIRCHFSCISNITLMRFEIYCCFYMVNSNSHRLQLNKSRFTIFYEKKKTHNCDSAIPEWHAHDFAFCRSTIRFLVIDIFQ